MNRRTVLIVSAAVILIAAIVFASQSFLYPSPTLLTGAPWDYTLSATDLGEKWVEEDNGLDTAFDMAQTLTRTVPAGLQSLYYMNLSNPTSPDAFTMSSQVLMYDSLSSAQSAFATEIPGMDWEKIVVPKAIGEGTVIWHLRSAVAEEQDTYRVDFRYLNAIHSLTATARRGDVKDAQFALAYSLKVLEKMQKNATPEAVRVLAAANKPDLRPLLLSQSEVAKIDPKFGERWIYDERVLPVWTPNSLLPDPKAVEAFGRVMGYQTMMVKALFEDESAPTISAGLLQQVTVYRDPNNAQKILDNMEGLGRGLWPSPPKVGDSARAWTATLAIEGDTLRNASFTEIDFRVDGYIASVRVQTMPILVSQSLVAGDSNKEIALKLAEALTVKLKAIKK